ADSGGEDLGDAEHADGKECPGAPDGTSELELQPGDIEVEQDAHPYDAPAAKSIEDARAPETPVMDFTEREIRLHNEINRTLNYFLEHPETVVRRGPWALMHATLPFGVETEIIAGNRRVNAIGWMCYNGVCARQRMFQATRSGFRTNVGPGVQGHEGQFLAILAQSRVSSEYPIKIGKRQYTIADLVRYEMSTCRERSELTFKLIGLAYYLEPDQRWRDNRGHYWNLEKMVADEMSQPVNGVACGGTHRLMGLSFAIIERQRAGLPITGTWARAETYLNDYVNYTMTLQNPDGSFSTNWFEGRGNKQDMERKVQTTGHMLEWLIYTLPDEYLRSPRIQVSIEYLLKSVGARPGYDWPIGPRGHALRALALYNQRVFGAEQGALKQYIATHPDGPTLR
ncbi:MAG: ADP-ribosylation factor-directed GTPase activating protein isoform b, partial [Planctomycetota bacterium]